MVRLSRVIVLVRDVGASVEFYTALGLRASSSSATHARIPLGNGIDLDLAVARSEAQLSSGYGPLLTLEVNDLDQVLPTLLTRGAALDGMVAREPYGSTATVRTPDGLMLALHERASLPGDAVQAVAARAHARGELEREGKLGSE